MFPMFRKCCQCFIRDCHSKIPPRRNSLMVAASPGDALPPELDLQRPGENKRGRQTALDAESSEEN